MDSARCAIRREIEETGLFRLKHRSEAGNEAFSNLVGEEWEQHALERDFAKRGITEDDILDAFIIAQPEGGLHHEHSNLRYQQKVHGVPIPAGADFFAEEEAVDVS
ncbi:TPA: hypothetical protein ACH3X3_003314 [Trebouxia sp. C0006]